MQAIFSELDHLVKESPQRWQRLRPAHQGENRYQMSTVSLQTMRVAVSVFTLIAAVIGVSLCLSSAVTPFHSGSLFAAIGKLAIGALFCLAAYDLNQMRDIIHRSALIFEEYSFNYAQGQVTRDRLSDWKERLAALKQDYTDLHLLDTILDLFQARRGGRRDETQPSES